MIVYLNRRPEILTSFKFTVYSWQ